MPEVMANGLQGFGHMRFYREPGDMQLVGNSLMAQAFHFGKAEYLSLLRRKLVYRFVQKFLILFIDQGKICIFHNLKTVSE